MRATAKLFFTIILITVAACARHGLLPTPNVAYAESVNISGENAAQSAMPAYDRKRFTHWIDEDGDCQNTRHEVLYRDASSPPTQSADGCKMVKGVWLDPYSGKKFTRARALDVDHVVPLHNAWYSGGYTWTSTMLRQYANDLDNPRHLLAVSAHENREKGARSPDQWMPSDPSIHCRYLRDWTTIKKQWKLTMTSAEHTYIESASQNCAIPVQLRSVRIVNHNYTIKDRAIQHTPETVDENTDSKNCCRICNTGKACGNSCIAPHLACQKARGCACQAQ